MAMLLYRRSHPRVSAQAAAYMRQYGQLVFTELTHYEVVRCYAYCRKPYEQ